MFFALYPILQQHVPSLSNVRYLLTGLGAITIGQNPNGLGGYIASAGQYAIYPAVQPDAAGNAAAVFTLSSRHRFPSAAFATLRAGARNFGPPVVAAAEPTWRASGAAVTLRGEIEDLGGASAVDVGFQHRRRKGVEELYTPELPWIDTAFVSRSSPGAFSAEVGGLQPGVEYEYRVVAKHPLLTIAGEEITLVPPVAGRR